LDKAKLSEVLAKRRLKNNKQELQRNKGEQIFFDGIICEVRL
jgi:hypothetical protein